MTKERDYTQTPVADSLGLRSIVLGLACDLEALRAGDITPENAMARAHLAKQIFNGVRLYFVGMKALENAARPINDVTQIEP